MRVRLNLVLVCFLLNWGNIECAHADSIGQSNIHLKLRERVNAHLRWMGAMQNYVMLCDVRSWRASGVMFDKTHCDRRSNNDWQDPLLVVVDEYLVDFLLKDDSVVEHCLRSCPRQVQEVELETLTSRSWSKGEWTDGRDTCVCSGRVLFSAGSKRPLSQDWPWASSRRPCQTSSLDRY